MAKFIDKSDQNNQELQMLPIRRGCSGVCACIGVCRNVVSYVDRKEYEDFVKTQGDINEFLTEKCNINK